MNFIPLVQVEVGGRDTGTGHEGFKSSHRGLPVAQIPQGHVSAISWIPFLWTGTCLKEIMEPLVIPLTREQSWFISTPEDHTAPGGNANIL